MKTNDAALANRPTVLAIKLCAMIIQVWSFVPMVIIGDKCERFVSWSSLVPSVSIIGKKCKYEKELVSLIQDTFNPSGGFDVPDLFPSLKFLGFLTGTKPALFKMHRMLLKLQETKELELNIHKNHIKAVTL
ncbi:cytochrome p450 cyp71d312, partial [Quercus suber]